MRKTNWPLTFSIAIVALTIGVIATYFVFEESERHYQAYIEELRYDYDELSDVLAFLNHLRTNHYFYDEDNDLIRGAIEGMIEETNDPWARLFSVEEYWSLAGYLFGESSGIGIRIMEVEEHAIIVEVTHGSPAQKYGLRLGDAILAIEDAQFDEYEFEDFIDKILGTSGSTVTLEIQRANDLLELEVIRGHVAHEEILSNIFEHEDKMIGYIRVLSFGVYTQEDFSNAITELERVGIDGLIIDMRDNPGGALVTLNTMVNYLLPNDRIITTTIDRDGREHIHRTRGDDSYRLDVDIVTLINGDSASASELFAAAMMESGGYEVIGTTSFGKGTAQTPMHIGNNILISTIQEGLTPTGAFIEGYGITPTIYVEMPEFYSFTPVHLSRGVVLEYDMVDPRIENAQLILESLGYNVDRTDGFFDDSTVSAVLAFQQSNELDETGAIDPETATALSVILFNKLQNTDYDEQLEAALDFLIGKGKQ